MKNVVAAAILAAWGSLCLAQAAHPGATTGSVVVLEYADKKGSAEAPPIQRPPDLDDGLGFSQ